MINLKTAKALDLKISEQLLQRDDTIIEMQILANIGLGLASSAFLGFELFRQTHLRAQLFQKNSPRKTVQTLIGGRTDAAGAK